MTLAIATVVGFCLIGFSLFAWGVASYMGAWVEG